MERNTTLIVSGLFVQGNRVDYETALNSDLPEIAKSSIVAKREDIAAGRILIVRDAIVYRPMAPKAEASAMLIYQSEVGAVLLGDVGDAERTA